MTALHYLLAAMLWLAAILQLCLLRDWTVIDSRVCESARWVLFGGLVGLASRFTLLMWDDGVLPLPFSSTLSIIFIAFALVVLSLERLLIRPAPGGIGRRVGDLKAAGLETLRRAHGAGPK